MKKIIGFIGSGNMAKAIIKGITESGLIEKNNVYASARTNETLEVMERDFGINTVKENIKVVENSDIIFLAVKPNVYPSVIEEVKEAVTKDKVLVSIAAGQSIDAIEKMFGREVKLIRTMPNTPSMVMEGMGLICPNANVTEDEIEEVVEIYNSFGRSEIVEEKLIDTAGSLSGCGPAFVYMFIEALAGCAIEYGVTAKMAYNLAAQTVLGSAKMVLETGEHTSKLKDNVCSPGGTTIKGVNKLEETGFRNSTIQGLKASIDKTLSMGKK